MQETIHENKLATTWFDELVGQLRADELQLSTRTAPPEMQRFYNTMFAGDVDAILNIGRELAQKHFVSAILFDYVESIKQTMPLKLAFDFHDTEISVWAEVENDNEKLEIQLLDAEAKVNAKFFKYGYTIETTIVEERDGLPIPNHYKAFK